MKKTKFLLLSLLMCFFVTSIAYAEEEYTVSEGSLSKSSATTISFGTNYVISVEELTDENALYFTFTTPEKKGILTCYSKYITAESYVNFLILDSNGITVEEDMEYTDVILSPSTTYYLKIYNHDAYYNSGNLKFRLDYNYDYGGDTMSTATSISCDKTYTDAASGEIDNDWYKFNTGKYSDYQIYVSNLDDDGMGCVDNGFILIKLCNSVEEILLDEQLFTLEECNNIVSLQKNKDYYIKFYHYTDGHGCEYTGFSDAYQFNISPVRTPMSSTVIKLSSTSYTYNGKAKTPTVTVKYAGKTLTKNVDYKVSYSNNTAAGIGKVTITGIGAYKGTTTKTFTIKLPKVTGLKQKNYSTKQVTLTWNKVNKATGYDIFRKDTKTGSYKYIGSTSSTKYTNKELKAGKTYYYVVRAFLKSNGKRVVSGVNSSSLTTTTRPAAPKLTVSSGSKYAKLNWKKVNGGSGYLVYMSTSKNGTYKLMATIGGKASKIATVGKTSITYKQKSLTKGKTYYFKMRSYKTTPSGNKVYSYGYGPIVSVKIK